MCNEVRSRNASNGLAAATILAALLSGPTAALAVNLSEPPVFASSRGVLDLLVVAKPEPVATISFAPPSGGAAIHPTGWVYEICPRPLYANQCPAGSVANYGGARLALQKGDTLRIRLVNKLPPLDPAKLTHVTDPGQANLFRNPTNLHTHGLLVQARAPTLDDPTFGDDIFVSIYNPANGTPVPQTAHQHGSIKMDFVDYRIDIPANHPSGLFWFHPHIHGIALNQVSGGLSGIITIGNAGDYAHGDVMDRPFAEANVRHLILKDMQVLAAGNIQFKSGAAQVANGEVLNQEDPNFCRQFPDTPLEDRHGSCPGADRTGDGGNNYTGGKWYFTVNGQQFPTVKMTAGNGEIWRLTNASGSLSYDLQLINDATRAPTMLQLVAVDGVSVQLPQDTPVDTMVELAGGKFRIVPCAAVPGVGYGSRPICVDEIVMMPSSRVELWVTYRDPSGRIVTPPSGATATFRAKGLTMGSGDQWPAVDLAKVEFAQSSLAGDVTYAMNVKGDARAAVQPAGIFAARNPDAKPAPLPPGCNALPPGHRRRIFFGLEDINDEASFGLGYEEVDAAGKPVPGTQRPVARFDALQSIVCLPLAPGQRPVNETWELVQLSTENHNFHIHQSRFRQIRERAPANSPLSPTLNPEIGAGIFQDNLPLGVATPHVADVTNNQNGVCTINQWRDGKCSSSPVAIDILFSQLGEFVYHCHILEHEDGGMMAKIKVVPSPF